MRVSSVCVLVCLFVFLHCLYSFFRKPEDFPHLWSTPICFPPSSLWFSLQRWPSSRVRSCRWCWASMCFFLDSPLPSGNISLPFDAVKEEICWCLSCQSFQEHWSGLIHEMNFISIAVRVGQLAWHDLAGYAVGNLCHSFWQKKQVLHVDSSLLPAVRPAACRSGSCDSLCHCPLLRAWCPGVVASSPYRSQSGSWVLWKEVWFTKFRVAEFSNV